MRVMHDPLHDEEYAKNLRISPFNEALSNDASLSARSTL